MALQGLGFVHPACFGQLELTRAVQNFLQIDVKKSVPQEGKPKACKVFVGGLAPETTEGEAFRNRYRIPYCIQRPA